jgi:hypothetical protein
MEKPMLMGLVKNNTDLDGKYLRRGCSSMIVVKKQNGR